GRRVEDDQAAVAVQGEGRGRRAVHGECERRILRVASGLRHVEREDVAQVGHAVDGGHLRQLERVLAGLGHREHLVGRLVVQAVPVEELPPAPAPVHVHLLDRGVSPLADVVERHGEEVPWQHPVGVAVLAAVLELDDGRLELRAALPAVALAGGDVRAQIFAHRFRAASRSFLAVSAARCVSLRRSASTGLMKFWVTLSARPPPPAARASVAAAGSTVPAVRGTNTSGPSSPTMCQRLASTSPPEARVPPKNPPSRLQMLPPAEPPAGSPFFPNSWSSSWFVDMSQSLSIRRSTALESASNTPTPSRRSSRKPRLASRNPSMASIWRSIASRSACSLRVLSTIASPSADSASTPAHFRLFQISCSSADSFTSWRWSSIASRVSR